MSREIVQQVLDAHADLIVVPKGEKFEDRRRSMLMPVIDALPGGRARWGILKKTGGVPSDVVTDLDSPTHEHIDVFSGEGVDDKTSRITASWKSNGDYRRHSPHWRRKTLDEALSKGWIDPLPDSAPPPDQSTHRYVGGGNDTGTCDQCGQPRAAAVHAVPESKVPHAYDGGEHDTGLCDICGQTSAAVIHQVEQLPAGDLEVRMAALEARVNRHLKE